MLVANTPTKVRVEFVKPLKYLHIDTHWSLPRTRSHESSRDLILNSENCVYIPSQNVVKLLLTGAGPKPVLAGDHFSSDLLLQHKCYIDLFN